MNKWSAILILALTAVLVPQDAASMGAEPPRAIFVFGSGAEESTDDFTLSIRGLDSLSFQERERATQSLIDMGPEIIPGLARAALNASPEANRRIKKCIEAIGIRGSEENLFRSMALLMTLYDRDSDAIREKIKDLRRQWVRQKSESAMKELMQLGADFTMPNPDELALGNQLVFLSPSLQEKPTATEVVAEKPRAQRLSNEDLEQQVEKILTAALDEVRAQVFEETNAASNEPDEIAAMRRQGLNGAVLLNGRLVMADSLQESGVRVRFDENFQGTDESLALLKHVDKLRVVEFAKSKINGDTLNAISDLPNVQQLLFQNCRIDSRSFVTTSLPPNVTILKFADAQIDMGLIDRISKHQRLQRLSFDNCAFSKSAFNRLVVTDPVRMLELRGIPLNGEVLGRLGKTKELSLLVLSGCKFEMADYAKLGTDRPDLRIELEAMAFLGVQSETIGYDTNLGCIISNVVPNSAAEDAGVQVGDRITKLNQEKIVKFEDLKTLMSQYEPGETIRLEIERSGRREMLSAKLKSLDERPRF